MLDITMPKSPIATKISAAGLALKAHILASDREMTGRPVQLFDIDPEFFRFPAADGFL